MPRPREHDSTKVRKATFRCFWERGFRNTSMEDLRRSSGLDPRQFIRDYGSKQGVFVQALRDFAEHAGHYMLARLEHGEAGVADLRWALDRLVTIESEEGNWGCLICSTAQDVQAMADDEVKRIVHAYLARIETAYHSAICRAVTASELVADENRGRGLARTFMAIHVSILILKRGGMDLALLRDVANQTLESLR